MNQKGARGQGSGVRRTGVGCAFVVTALLALPGSTLGGSPPDKVVHFAESICPILVKNCVGCHGPDKQKGGLRLDRRDLALRGGQSGKVIEPGKSGESLLIKRLTADDPEERMPAQGDPLAPDEINLIKRWIDQGALWPETADALAVASKHWSFQAIRAASPPPVQHRQWLRNPIDAFILAQLEKQRLDPAPEADQQTLLRRLALDLTGLPPTTAEVLDFVRDQCPDAYERQVDRLLASPHFGERWGQRWLDLARYADSDGFEQDEPRPFAYRWRDWVIRAFNADMPFDRFTVEQLAGHLLPQATPDQLLATGFHRNTPTNGEGGADKEEARHVELVDRVSTTGTVWLGLTIGCAECHSHKFDPISTTEFYRLFAFFNDEVAEVGIKGAPTAADAAQNKREVEAYNQRLVELRQRVAQATLKERERAESFLKRLEKKGRPKLEVTLAAFGVDPKPRHTRVHVSGDCRNLGAGVEPGVPAVLPRLVSRRGDKQPCDLLDLAKWLVDPANPLPARVEANRIWQHLFGAGIVFTPEDFGTQGDPPSHPELLDYLATRLVQSGWSRKALIRAIVLSSAYRQDSTGLSDAGARDPENRLVHRQNRFRLEAEIVHDLTLATAGILNPTMGGPCARPPLPDGFKTFAYKFQWTADRPPDSERRALYIFYQRNMIFPMLRTFDRSDTNLTCVRRERSNTPLQALTLLNDKEFLKAHRALGLEMARASRLSTEARIDALWFRCLGRPPERGERETVMRAFHELRRYYHESPEAALALVGKKCDCPARPEDAAAWIGISRVVMNTDNFTMRE